MTTRVEHDLLGPVEIPALVYWGAHTARAVTNFPLAGRPVRPGLVRAIAMVKKAACRANEELGYLPPDVARAIHQACDEVAAGALGDQFPVDALQGGAGTSANMNVNEVVANRALELLGAARGDYARIHPIETVNLHQSTNDVFPTAVKVAAIFELRALSESIARLQGVFQQREKEFAGIVKMGRTELQEAIPLTLGAEFSAFAEAFARDRWRTFKCEERLRVVNLGGTAIGTGLTAPRAYIFLVVDRLREITGLGLTRAENLVEQTANADAFAEVSGILEACACNFVKVAGDLRLLQLLGELRLPPCQAGSSIMPGKVNPVIMEAVIQGGMRVRANHGALAEAVSRGSLQINEFLPLIADSLLESLELLTAMAGMMRRQVEGLEARGEVCRLLADRSVTLVTAFLPSIGYERAEALVKEFEARGGCDFRAFLVERLGRDAVERTLSPASLMALGFRGDLESPRP
ncbi:MAG: aspartate ammonia-lyase [Planctomycetes bacterium]|nr:aspartate ammonia-lyase [Planctomycetota bacterium]